MFENEDRLLKYLENHFNAMCEAVLLCAPGAQLIAIWFRCSDINGAANITANQVPIWQLVPQ